MFTALAKLSELEDGFQKLVQLRGKPYVLLQAEGQVYLVENRCPHMDAPLFQGQINGELLRCRAHGIAFSLTTGSAQGPLAGSLDCLHFLPVVFDGDAVGVEVI